MKRCSLSSLTDILGILPQRWKQYRRKVARRPKVLRKWYQWESVRTEYTQVYYVVASNADVQEVARIAQGCDETLLRVAALLGVKLTNRLVPVFLYPDFQAFQRCEQIHGTPFYALMRDDNVSLPYHPWRQIARTLAHELTHLVSARYICGNNFHLLDEGLAMYVSRKLYPRGDAPSAPLLDTTLITLASGNCLAGCLANSATSHETYDHVHSFAWYLIEHYGMDSFLRLFRGAAGRTRKQKEKRFLAALHKTYGLTVEDLEQQWRQRVREG